MMLDAGLILAQFIGRVSQKKEPMTIQQFPLEAPRGNPVGQMNCAFAGEFFYLGFSMGSLSCRLKT